MPITNVEAPDESIIKVEHPEGASREQIIAFAEREFKNRQFSQSLPQIEAEPAVPQGGSIADPLGQGLTFGFADEIAGVLGAGVNSTLNLFGKGTGESFGQAFRGIRDIARENEAAFRERNPGTALTAEIVGGLGTGGVGAARAGAFQAARNAPTFLGRVAPAIQTGAVQGGAFGAGKSEADTPQGVARDVLQGAAIGGLTAPILPALASGARSTASRVLQTNDTRAFRAAKDLLSDRVPGIRLTSGQRTGSTTLRSAETTAAETITGARLGRQLGQNRDLLQGKLMRMAGFSRAHPDVKAGKVTQEAIDDASARFSRNYEKLLGNRTLSVDEDRLVDRLADVATENKALLPFQQKKLVDDIVNQTFDNFTSKPANARLYQRLRSQLGQLEGDNLIRNPGLSRLYRQIKHAIDDEMFAASGIGLRKRAIDRSYNRFAKIRDTFDSSGAIGTSRGELPLSNLLRRAAKRGKGADREFTDLVRAGQAVLGDPVANSATASRLINAAILGEGTAAFTGLIDPTAGLATLGLPFAANQALARGFTGSPTVDRLIQSGLLTAPITVPTFGQFDAQQ